jgi:hypothetical protein
MRTIAALVALLAFSIARAAMQSADYEIRLGTPILLAWDYADLSCLDCDGGPIVRFEVRVDELAPLDAGLDELEPGTFRYLLPPELLPMGRHSVWVRACNALECSEEAGVTLRIRGRLPPPPVNSRLLVPLDKSLARRIRS